MQDNIFNLFFSEVLHQDQECQDHEVIEEEDEAQDEEDVPSLNRTVSANSSSSAHIEYANRGRVSNEIWKMYFFAHDCTVYILFFLNFYRECSGLKVEPNMFEGVKKNPLQLLWP